MSGSSGTVLLPYALTVVRRSIFILGGVLLVIASGLGIGSYQLMSGDGVRLALERQATSWLGQPVKIGAASARIFPRPGLTLHDVRAGEPVRLTLSDLQISTGLRPLWSRRIADAEVPRRVHLQARIIWHGADPALCLGRLHLLSGICAAGRSLMRW